jgi:uncharacterized membrane protein
VHPFDLKSALLAKHAQHIVLIHFPIALFIAGVAFDLIALITKRRSFADAAYYNLMLAAISTIPVLATGVLAWQFALEGQKLKGILLLHLVLACASTVMIWLVWWGPSTTTLPLNCWPSHSYRSRRISGDFSAE